MVPGAPHPHLLADHSTGHTLQGEWVCITDDQCSKGLTKPCVYYSSFMDASIDESLYYCNREYPFISQIKKIVYILMHHQIILRSNFKHLI